MEDVKSLDTIDEIRAFSDPYRMQILNCIHKLGEAVTVKQIADELKEVPAKVHYHVKKLESVGILRLAYTREINGIIAKYYELTAKRFVVRRPDLDPACYGNMVGETHKFITTAYNTSLKNFIENIGEEGLFSNKKEGSLCMSSLFLTDEEFSGFWSFIEQFCDMHDKRKEGPDIKEYHFFSTITKSK